MYTIISLPDYDCFLLYENEVLLFNAYCDNIENFYWMIRGYKIGNLRGNRLPNPMDIPIIEYKSTVGLQECSFMGTLSEFKTRLEKNNFEVTYRSENINEE